MANVNSIRQEKRVTLSLASGATATEAVDFRHFSMLAVHMGSTWTLAGIGLLVSDMSSGTFQPLYDYAGALVEIDTATKSLSYMMPTEIAPVRYFKLWSQSGGVSVTQSTTSISISMKS